MIAPSRMLALALLLAGAPASAQGLAGDPARGQAAAERWCVDCHELTPGMREPSAVVIPGSRGPSAVEVPSFQAVADDPAATETALRAFLHTPHANMPDIRLTPEQTDDLIAYILSLKGHRPGT